VPWQVNAIRKEITILKSLTRIHDKDGAVGKKE
jgi:hypothetical protein